MKLKIENIGMIRSADIKLDGLTVIAGENDTGKSTVGKLIFSLVKAFNRYEEDFNESKNSRVLDLIEKIYFNLRKGADLVDSIIIQQEFNPKAFFKELKNNQGDELDSLINYKITKLEELDYSNKAINLLGMVKEILQNEEDKNTIIKRALTKAFISEFYLDLSPKNNNNDSLINISEGVNNILDVSINANKIDSLALHDDLSFNDATFIETPIFLQMYDLIRSASTLFEIPEDKNERISRMGRPRVALHTKDLVSKLESAQYDIFPDSIFSLGGDNNKPLIDEICNITKGKGFSFDRKEKDFYFNKDENTKFKSINTATGLKSFGIIQLLIQADFLDERSLLIIDEPEIHLHPKWQVEYAKLIVALVKNDIPVLITSHSPEIIQALSVFSEEYGIQDRTAFYLTESDGVSSQINDVTEDINKIFTTLAEPLHNLVWG